MMKILCAQSVVQALPLFSQLGEVTLLADKTIQEMGTGDNDALIIRSKTRVDKHLLAKSPHQLRFVGTATAGFDHLDYSDLQQQGIYTCHAPGCNANSVAEYVISALLYLNQQQGFSLAEKALGIVGLGQVGRALAAKARLLGLRVLANDPPLQEQGCNDLVSLKTLLNEADIVSLHVPLEYLGHHPTYHLAGLAFFAQLKQGSVFINTSRGAVTDSAALKQALVAKPTLTHAILDVWEEEPEVDVNLLQQVTLLTPHIAGYSYEGRLRGSLQIYHQLASFCRSSLPFPSLSTEIGSLESIDLQVKPDSNLWGLLWQAVKEVYNIEQDCQNLKEQDFHQLRKNYPKRYEFSHYRLCLSQPHKEFERIARGLGFEVG